MRKKNSSRDVPVALRLPVRTQVLLPRRQRHKDAVAEVPAAVRERPDGVGLECRQEHDEVSGSVRAALLLQERQRNIRLLHLCHGQFMRQMAVLRLQGFDGVRRLLLRGGCEVHDPHDVRLLDVVVRERPGAADHVHAGAAVRLLRIHDLDEADLPGPRHMRGAAGADVVPGDGHEAHVLGQFKFAAVVEVRQSRRVRVLRIHFDVLPDGAVHDPLDFPELLVRELTVEVAGHVPVAEVEPDVVEAVEAMHRSGHQVFPGVVLHPFKTLFPVEDTGHLRPGRHGPVAVMGDDAVVRDLHVHDLHGAGQRRLAVLLELLQGAGVGVLPAAFREEGRPVQNDRVEAFSVLRLLTGDDGRRERLAVGVGVIEFFGNKWFIHRSEYSFPGYLKW